MNRLRDINLRSKHILLVIIPIIALLYFVIAQVTNRIQLVAEMNNIQNLVGLSVRVSNLVHELQRERAQVAAFIGSEGTSFEQEMRGQRDISTLFQTELTTYVSTLDAADFGPEFQALVNDATGSLQQLPAVRNQTDSLQIDSQSALDVYSDINEQLLDLIAFAAQLTSDGEISRLLTNYNLFLQTKELAGQERAILADVFAANRVKPSELGAFVTAIGGQNALLESFFTSSTAEEIAIYNNTVQGPAIDDFLRLRQVAINNSAIGNFGVAVDLWFNAATTRIDLFKQVEDQLTVSLVDTSTGIQNAAQVNLIISIVVAVITLILTAVLALLISRNITEPLGQIMGTFAEVGRGNLNSRVSIVGRDELGRMGQELNSMLDNTISLVQTSEERDDIENAIMQLLDDVAGVAEGDLTGEAQINEDLTGAIADSFNYMIEQLRDIITNVQEATLQVSSSANEIQTTAEHLAEGSENQAAQIIDTSAAIDEMSVSIQQVSENATLSANVGEQASINAQRGTEAVKNTINGMNRIQEQVAESAERIRTLTSSARQINEFVKLIKSIADRTSILALNASIQAARAGVAGTGFAVVAEEVERLSERSTDATRQINAITRTVQQESEAALVAMEATTREVTTGTMLANEAGERLNEIETVSQQLADLIQSISLAAKQQARGSETIAQAMNDIADVTQQTAAGTKQAAVSINTLAELANELRGSVSTFKLPNGQHG
ncbi:MAG: nitrate- and nitrite sensing domain-containing protein [Chloroflexota bacterium]